jgi:NPCBM/NEW2 domain
MRRTALLALIPLLLATIATAAPVSLTTISGPARTGELAGLAEGKIKVDLDGGSSIETPLDEVVGLTFRPPTTTPAGEDALPPGKEEEDTAVVIRLAGGDRLVGILVDGSEDNVKIRSRLLGEVTVPLDAVRSILFTKAGETATRSRPHEAKDSLTNRHGDYMSCWVASFTKTAVHVDCVVKDDYRITYAEVAAIHFHQDEPEAPEGLVVRLTLTDGSRITARAPTLAKGRLSIRPVIATAEDAPAWTLPIEAVSHLTVLGGAYVHLSDLTDWTAVVVPFFPPADPMLNPSEWLAPERDLAFGGTRLTLRKQMFHKGVGAVSGTTIKVNLKGAYRSFKATVGVDRIAGPRGSVTFEVLVDGKERWKSPVLRGDSAPLSIPSVNLKGAKVLELRVGYGDESGADVQDLADWAEAILIK